MRYGPVHAAPGCRIVWGAAGLTLVELMIVLSIIAILAAIAIPNFLSYRTKARQAEAKIQLKAIHTSEMGYFTENNYFTPDVYALEWRPQTDLYYRYSVGVGFMGNPDPVGSPMNNAPADADAFNFTAVAWANIDKDEAVDTWQVTQVYSIDNVYDDVAQEGPL
jgi:prepilin-type N-terminal cleavage/methylation domain-containing protein